MFRSLFLITFFLGGLTAQAQDFSLTCHGAEPFWSAKLTQQTIEMDFVEKKTYSVDKVTGAAGYVDSFVRVLKDDQNKPLAVVIATDCNDSMSDFTYPWQVVLMTEQANFYGCCGEPKSSDY